MTDPYSDETGLDPATDRQMTLLLEAARRILRPMARLFLGRLPCDVAVKLLKLAYIEEGRRKLETKNPGKRVTKSALALLIGLDTRVISNLEKKAQARIDLARALPYSSVLAMWVIGEEWRDPASGCPRKLKIYGPGPTFQTLVIKSVGKNISYQRVLDNLVAEGNLELDPDGQHVSLRSNTYQALSHNEAVTMKTGSLAIGFAYDMVNHNIDLAEGEKRWPAHVLWTDRLPPKHLPALRRKLEDLIVRHVAEYEAVFDPVDELPYRDDAMTAGVELFYWQKDGTPPGV